MDPYVLRLVSRGKTPQTSRLEHIPKLWLRAPVRVELACSGPEDSAAALAAVANYSLAIHSLDADRKPVDSPLLWYQVVSPAGNTGATKGPHAVFEIGTAEIANITEAGDYWIAVHAHTVDERIVRAAGYITLLDDGFPSTPPTPTPPGTIWLTQAAGDARYVNTTGDIMTGTLTLPAIGLRHAASGFDAVVIASVLTNDRELLLPDEDGTLATREWATANISGGGGGGGGATNISITADSTTVTVNSSTGSDGTITGATNAVAGVMTAAHVIALDGKVNKAGDTMTGMLTVPDITITNSATFGTVLAHNEISTVATAVRENQFPNADGVFALASNTEGVPDKLGTRAKCNVAAGVTKGNVVYLDGADGNNPTFALANASSEATSSKTYGFIDRACTVNGFGFIITNGVLDGLSIAASYAEPGDSVWLSTVSGGIEVGVPPAKPAHSVYLGIATKVSNSGQLGATIQTIEVKVQNGYELSELHDVNDQVTGSTAFLVKNSGTGVWESKNSADARVNLDVPSVGDLDAQRVDIQTFGGPSTSGSFTWVKPANAKLVLIRIIGAGSGGASGICRATSVLRTGGGGGAGGAAAIQLIPAVDLPATVTVTVGVGSAGGVGTNNTAASHANAVQGGASFFGSYRANGGGATNGTTAATGLTGSVFSLLAGAAAGNGGAGNTTGGAGANAAVQPSHFVGTGGGGGGSAAAGSVAGANGGSGGDRLATAAPLGYGVLLAGGVAGISGGSGSSGGAGNNQDQSIAAGTGGGGGAYVTGANGGNGGQGGWPGGGGGGGGAADDGFTAGSGGRGGHGMVQVITYF